MTNLSPSLPRFVLALAAVLAQAAPALAQDEGDGRRPLALQPLPPPADAPEKQAVTRDARDEAPRHAFVESPFNLSQGTLFAGVVAEGTTQRGAQTSEGGIRLGGAPLPRLALHGLVGRDSTGKWTPTATAHYRILGSLEDGAALGALAQYKTEGFTKAGGEAEIGLTAGLRRSRFVLDANLVAGLGVEESEVGEMDAEAKVRVGYDVLDSLRLGAEGQVRRRLAGDRLLAGNKRWDVLAGPQLLARLGRVTLAATGGATTVNLATGTGAFGMLSLTAMTN